MADKKEGLINENKLSDEELKQIAQDLYSGKIFTDRHIKNVVSTRMVFLPLHFLDEKQALKFKKDVDSGRISLMYQYIDKAGPRAINGMPIFMSFHTLNKKQTEKVFDYYNKIKAAIKKL